MTLLFALAAHAGTVSLAPGDDIIAKTQGLGAGDEVIFIGGVYEIDSTISWEGLGTAEAPITIYGRQDDDEVIIRMIGAGTVAEVRNSTFLTVRNLSFEGGPGWEEGGYGGVRVVDSSDVTLEGNTVRFVQYTGIDIDGNGANLDIVGNHVHDTIDGSGIYAGCGDASCWIQDSVVAGNQLHDLGGDYVTGIRMENGCQNIEIRDNVVYRVGTLEGGDGIVTGTTEFGLPNLIVGNIVWQTTDDGIWVEGPARVQNNIVFGVGDNGIGSRNNDRDGLTDVVISFNTVADTGSDGVRLEDWYQRDGMVFANNLVSNPIGYGFDYESEWEEGESTTNFISANHVTGLVEGFDPLLFPGWVVPGGGMADFVDAGNWDFYPAQRSAVVNAADASGEAWVPTIDFNGVPRQGDAPDVGAYEWVSGNNPGWTIQEGFKELGYTADGSSDVPSGCCKGKEAEDEPSEALFLLPLGLGWMLRRRRRA